MKATVIVTLTVDVKSEADAKQKRAELDETLKSPTTRFFLRQRGVDLVGLTVGEVKIHK